LRRLKVIQHGQVFKLKTNGADDQPLVDVPTQVVNG